MGGDPGLGAEKFVEMRARKPGLARDRIELDLGAEAFGKKFHRLADPKVGDAGACPAFRGDVLLAPALFVTSIDQAAQLAVQTIEGGRAAYHGRRGSNISIQ